MQIHRLETPRHDRAQRSISRFFRGAPGNGEFLAGAWTFSWPVSSNDDAVERGREAGMSRTEKGARLLRLILTALLLPRWVLCLGWPPTKFLMIQGDSISA